MKLTQTLRNRDFENYKDLLFVLLQKEMKVRYQDKVLGYLWSVASPLTYAIVYFFAFKLVMRIAIEDYPLALLSVLFPWQWFSNGVEFAPLLFIFNAPIIKKVNFPRDIISLAASLNHLLHFVFSLPVLFFLVFLYQRSPSITWLYGIPLLMLIQVLTIHGITLLFASLNLFLRDIERLVSVITSFVFFFTPIVYTLDMVPPEFQALMKFNPAAPLMINWRNIFVNGTLDYGYLGLSAGYALLFLVIGYAVYKKLSWKFAEVV